MSIDALKDTFFEEAEELIDALVDGLKAMASGDWDAETVNAIFRSVHSIKGAAGAFGLENLVKFSHIYETVLDRIRSDELAIDEAVLKVITRSSDVLAELLDLSRVGSDEEPSAMAGLLGELKKFSSDGDDSTALMNSDELSGQAQGDDPDFGFSPLTVSPIEIDIVPSTKTVLEFKPRPELFSNGHEPTTIFKALIHEGLHAQVCDTNNIPQLEDFDPDGSYLIWHLKFEGEVDLTHVRQKFGFVDSLCDLKIVNVLESTESSDANAEVIQENKLSLDDIPTENEGKNAIPQKMGKLEKNSNRATKAPPKTSGGPVGVSSTIRVDPERVDRLINTVSELIINQAVIGQKVKNNGKINDTELLGALDEYRELAREIQEGVMSIRAQPIKSLFQRMGRVVREASDATGKDIEFVTEGETTEIDKTLLERLADPLTHMLRNAVDHGIETAEIRRTKSKPEKGTVRLSASHHSGNVLIEVSDDGAGLDVEKIRSKAISSELITNDTTLSEAETFSLLFAAGFSTADSVTNLSGRGVGMDVVKTSITSLGGKISIQSRVGKGSTFAIQMPLTLAVMDGMIITIGNDVMVIPLSSVVETVRPKDADIVKLDTCEKMLNVRGACLPIIDLASVFSMNSNKSKNCPHIIVNSDNGTKIALAVDTISDQRQVVVKSLEGNYVTVPGIAAATILGDGKIALIVDANSLAELSTQKRDRTK